MLLNEQKRLTFGSCWVCDSCRNLGLSVSDVKIWPIMPQRFDEGVTKWKVYIKSSHRSGKFRSRHAEIFVCYQHHKIMMWYWEEVVRIEVDEYRAWVAYLERAKR